MVGKISEARAMVWRPSAAVAAAIPSLLIFISSNPFSDDPNGRQVAASALSASDFVPFCA